jgi:hypothetical protein
MITEIAEPRLNLPFHQWLRNVNSQCGEDGVIEKVLHLCGVNHGYFVEFGAWDGRHLSNCAKLADEGWGGCFIEGETERFLKLRESYSARPGITTVNAFVTTEGDYSLDAILQRHNTPSDIAVLSIDVDGIDYHIWASLIRYSPMLCIIEFNPTISANVGYFQENDITVSRGCSLRALWRLAQEKGYALVAATELNGFFLREDIRQKNRIPAFTPEEVKSTRYETFLFHGYDGTLITAGYRNLLWHDIAFGETDLQILPPELRRFLACEPPSYLEALDRFKRRRGK